MDCSKYTIQQNKEIKEIKETSIDSIICIDISGSVNGHKVYWNTVKHIVDEWCKTYPNPIWCFWNTSAYKTLDKNIYLNHLNYYLGNGGTESHHIVTILKQLKCKENICIITDGEVDHRSIDQCDKELQHFHINNVECHIINSNPNCSVSCPFTRHNTSKVYTHTNTYNQSQFNPTLILSTNIDDYKLLDQLKTISYDNFIEKSDQIIQCLIQVNMGSNGHSGYKDALIHLKKRLVQEHSKRSKLDNQTDINQEIRKELNNNNVKQSIDLSTKITKQFYASAIENDSIISKLDKCIQMCSGSLRSSFNPNQIKSNAFIRNSFVDEVDHNQLQQPIQEPEVFECPISYDIDTCCLLVSFGADFWNELDHNQTEFIREAPLRALNNQNIVSSIKKCIQHSVGLRTVPELNGQNPFTRQSYDGILSFANEPTHIQANNYVLSKIISKGKAFGNIDMWLYVIYKCCSELEYCKEILDLFRQHLIWRYQQTSSFASLNGLGILPTTMLNFDICCWYVLSSTQYVYSPKHDVVRFHLPHLKHIIDIVKMCFPLLEIPKEIDSYIARLKFFTDVLRYSKQSHSHYLFLQDCAKSLFQECIINLDELKCAFIDGYSTKSFKERIEIIDQFSFIYDICPYFEEPIHFYNWLKNAIEYAGHPSKNLSDLDVNSISTIDCQVQTFEDNWKFTDYETYTKTLLANTQETSIKICYNTFRPYSSVIDKKSNNKITWKESCTQLYGTLNGDTFSGCRYFLDYFCAYCKIPTKEEYVMYCYERIKNKKCFKIPTCPKSIFNVYQSMLNDYKEVFMRAKNDHLKPKEIKNRIEQSVCLKDRIKFENKK